MSRHARRVAIAVGLVTAGAVVWRLASPGGVVALPREYRVERRMIGETLTERGWLVPLDSESVRMGLSGDIQEIARSGTRVTNGQVIVRVDDTEVQDRMDEVEFNIHDAESSKASSEADYAYTACVESNRLDRLRKQLESARVAEQEARIGLKPEDRRLLEIEREIAKLDLLDGKETLERQQRLFDKGFISQAMLDPYARRVETLRASCDEIAARIRLEEKGVPPERLLELSKTVERISGLLARGEKAMARRLEAVQRQIDVAEARLQENLDDRRQVAEELANSDIEAARSGIFAVRMYYERQVGEWAEYKPGAHAYKLDPVGDIVNPGKVKIEIMINEADIDRVSQGLPARIRMPAFPGREFSGRLVELGGVGRDRADVAPRGYESGDSGVTMFNGSVSLEGDGMEFRPGMSATVTLELSEPRECLVVPRVAVKVDDGRYWVMRREADGGLRPRELRGHVATDDELVVDAGLNEGDVVVVTAAGEDVQ